MVRPKEDALVERNPRKEYKIQDVMKFCDMSRKQLLYYEEKGLLTGVHRDCNNNYRWYDQSHINRLFIIREYLSMGYSLNDISKILINGDIPTMDDCINRRMDEARHDYYESMQHYEQIANKYLQLKEGLSLLRMWRLYGNQRSDERMCEVISYPVQRTITFEGRGCPTSSASYSQACIADLYIEMRKYGLHANGPLQFLFRSLVSEDATEMKRGDVDVLRSFPIVDISGRYRDMTEIGGFICATAVHVGGYDESLIKTYEILLSWCRKQGLKLQGDSLELYLIGVEMAPEKDSRVTRILLPLKQ